MKRLVLVPLLAAAALTGCVTDYAYRGGDRGDYYYGRPSVEYRYHDPYGTGPYGGLYGGYGYYGRPGFYRNPYYGYPYYGYPYYRPPVVIVRPPADGRPGPGHDDNDRPPPWRDLRPRRPVTGPEPGGLPPNPPERSIPRRAENGSRMGQAIERARGRRIAPPSGNPEP